MLIVSNVDCSNYVCQFINYIDIICYKSLNKIHYKHIVLPDFKQIFMNKLVECEVVPSSDEAILFCKALYDTGAYVAGSFILDCLLGTNYHDDIDIYDQTGMDYTIDNDGNINYNDPAYFRYSKSINLYLRQYLDYKEVDYTVDSDGNINYDDPKYYKEFTSNNLKFTQYLYNANFENIKCTSAVVPILRSYINKSSSDYKPTLKNDFILGNNNIDNLKNTIQIIPVDMKIKHGQRSVIPRFIKASFDLEICQNIFDGNMVYIKNLDKLVRKYDYIKVNTMFTVAVYSSYGPMYKDYKKEVTMKRMVKYCDRGFDIQLHPQHEEMHEVVNRLYSIHNSASDYIKYIDDGTIDLSKYDINKL